MKRLLTSTFIALALCLPHAVQAKVTHLLPKPQKVEVTSGTPFALGRTVTITDPTNCSLLEEFFTGNGCTVADGGAEVTVTLASSIDGTYDYTPGFTGTRTNSTRGINSITLASTSYPDHAANSLSIGTSEFSQCYVDKSDVTMKAGAGDVVTITTGIAGSWMNSYVYIDRDKNGFTAGIAADGFTPTDDLVSYSFYNNGASSDESGKNSAGATITGNSRSTVSLPQFTVPAEPGTYRMRVKLDWCNIDPNGDQDGKFGDFMANGGHIIDVTLEVAEAQEGVVSQIFSPTTIVDGDFAQGTVWYTLQIAANGFVIDNNGTADYIALDEYMSDATNDAQLWAFVGDNTNGYRLYNKEAGAAKVLAAPTAMTGTTGSTSYPKLVDAANIPGGYTDLWLFTPSGDLGEGETYFYMYEKGYPSNKVNNRDNRLAFWNAGADGGSTLNIRFAQTEYAINTGTGEWTSSNAAKTWASAWKSTAAPHISLTESQGRNNMAGYGNSNNIQLFTCLANATVNGVYTATYNIAADEGYIISGYRFSFVSSGTSDVTVTPNGMSGVTANSTTAKSVAVSSQKENSLSFTVTSGSNMFANTTGFYATIARAAAEVEESQNIFVTNKGGIPYRIPAIAMASNGDLIAVADYRHSGADIGVVNNGRIDLLARISKDNGATWGERFAIVEGKGSSSPDFMHVGFGDPCIVADRESSRVLVLSCAGNVSFQSGTRNNHQNIARFYSEDNGATWSEPVDIAESIYSKWDYSTQGPVMAMFVGSGKIHQSRYVKVGNYYRLYCAVLLKNKNATYTNFVLYSDNFGDSWEVLGGVDTAPIPDGADEPKVEELPNGNVVVSSRCNGGRHFNIFTFTDAKAAQGSWGTRATSNSSVNGVVALGNSTNGEIMIFPAIRNEDNAETWIALQSLPFGSGRANVGIYYKELENESDYNTPANFAKDWDGRHQASYLGSAYSTMCFQKDSTIAFLYEEETFGAGYTIVYKNYSIETITKGAYSMPKEDVPTGIEERKGENEKVKGIYDLQGRKLKGENGKLKGFYIIDGKKTYIK
ncbi:MAG: exo-alpha-sialidase [Bacteroidaceae bacterium]|nr:exo-alpha-sialidase [Bacteroidaceae bacterium]